MIHEVDNTKTIFSGLGDIGSDALEPLVLKEPLSGSGSAQTYRMSLVIKEGLCADIAQEAAIYERLRTGVGEHADLLFPKTVCRLSPEKGTGLLCVESLRGRTLEKDILEIGTLAAVIGSHRVEIRVRQQAVSRTVEHVLAHLDLLHRSLQVERGTREALREFVLELGDALTNSLKLARTPLSLPDFKFQERFWTTGVATLAHRDLSVVNIIVHDELVRFIDPRSVVPNGTLGAEFASPAIDLVALSVSLERKELELKRLCPEITLEARELVAAKLRSAEESGVAGRNLIRLSEAVVRSAYAACRCAYCLAPERLWLYEKMYADTLVCVQRL